MSDSEYDVEECLVYADFKNQTVPSSLCDPKSVIKIIGIEDKNPIAEVNGCVFKGNYEHSIGTLVFFEEDNSEESEDPLYETTPKQKYKYFCKTDKVINFQRLYVKAKHQETTVENNSKDENKDRAEQKFSLKLDNTYEDCIEQLPQLQDE